MKRVLLPLLIFVVFLGFVLYRIKLTDRTIPPGPKPRPNYKNIVLYVDESISMRGYFRVMPQEGTPVQRFLWNNIMVLLNSSFPGDTVYCSTFGSEINVPGKRCSLLDRYHFNSAEELNDTFSHNKTRLVELFNGD